MAEGENLSIPFVLMERSQMAAVGLIVACGVASIVTVRSAYDSLRESLATYYRDYRFADVFASLRRAPNAAVRDALRTAYAMVLPPPRDPEADRSGMLWSTLLDGRALARVKVQDDCASRAQRAGAFRTMRAGGILQQRAGPVIRTGLLLLFPPFMKQADTGSFVSRLIGLKHPAPFPDKSIARGPRGFK